jgi:hypothetical protein
MAWYLSPYLFPSNPPCQNQVISREGDNLKVRDGSGEENVYPLQSAFSIGMGNKTGILRFLLLILLLLILLLLLPLLLLPSSLEKSGELGRFVLTVLFATSGTAVAREDLLSMCAKRDVRAEDEADAGGEAGGVDGKKPTLAKMESNVSGTDGSEIDAGEMKKSFFKMSSSTSLEEIDMEQLVAAAPQPPPCAELVLGEIPVHVDGNGTCKGGTG